MENSQNLSAKDIHSKREKLWDASISQHKKYINKETGLFDDKYVETRTCPSCESSPEHHITIMNKEGGTYVKCKSCAMVFLNPVFKDEFLNEYYSNNHDVQAEIVEEDLGFYNSIYSKGLELADRNSINKDNILDFGCSSGIFLNLAKEHGWKNSHGIELNVKEAAVASSRGHAVESVWLDKYDPGKKFDLITLWDVFEHLKNGDEFLTHAKKHLNENGHIFFQIPSSDALAARVMQESCNMFDGLEHVNLYGKNSLETLCERVGYKIVDITTVISEIKVMNNFLNYESPYKGNQPSTDQLFGIFNEDNIHKNLLGYKFQVLLKPLS